MGVKNLPFDLSGLGETQVDGEVGRVSDKGKKVT